MKYFLILCSASAFIAADAFSANWGKTGHGLSLMLMLIAGCLGYLLFGLLNQKTSLAVSGGLVNVTLVVGSLAVSFFYFEEILSIRQLIGIFFACVAIALMNS